VTPRISLVANSVCKICQLTGQRDRQLNRDTLNQTETKYHLFGTDLGSSFEHGGKLWFLFGDTVPVGSQGDASDSVAWTTDTNPDQCVHLNFLNDNGVFRSPKLLDQDGRVINTGGFNVPLADFSVREPADTGERMYVFYSTGSFTETGGDGGLDAFWTGPDGGVGSTWANPTVDGARWRPSFPIAPPGSARAESPVAAITRFNGALDVFWIGPDGGVGTTWANPDIDGGNWHAPFPIAPARAMRADSPLAAITRLGGALDVFWIGPDGGVGTTWANPNVDGGRWHTPFRIAPPGATGAGSHLAAVTRLEGALDVFWIGPDGGVGTTWVNPNVDGGRWHTPFGIAPPRSARAGSPIAVITRFNGALDVFWIGPDGAVATTWANPDIDNGRWHAPFPISPPGSARADSSLAAITRLDEALDVFWIGPDGAVATTWANPRVDNGRWHPPFPIAPAGSARSESPVAALTRLAGALDVFWIGPDGAVGTTWANPSIDGGRWHAPFPINRPGSAAGSAVAALTRKNGGSRILMGSSVLSSAVGNDPTNLRAIYEFSRVRQDGKFLNVACVEAGANFPHLPFQDPGLLAWGSGRYRDSDVYLACIPLHSVENPQAWMFLSHVDAATNPTWSMDQKASMPLFDQPQVGELSVVWVQPLGLWLMLYNAATPRGINGRVAASPWGPWSEPIIVFDPALGYGKFMHVKDAEDGLYDPGRKGEWGGEYGPYMIARYTRAITGTPNPQAQSYFVLSTWNPYNTMLLTATIQREADQ
jgi:Domain of unknown function (DUF4185)